MSRQRELKLTKDDCSETSPLTVQNTLSPALAERLATHVAPLGARKNIWTYLRAEGALNVSLQGFYKQTKDKPLSAALLSLCTDVSAVEVLLKKPLPKPAPRVAVSTVAQQFYCDLQVHLDTVHEVRVLSRAMAAGAAAHAAIEAEAEEVSEEEVSRRMDAGEEQGLVEMPLSGMLHGVHLVGRADRVQFAGRTAKLVLEWKFSNFRGLNAPYVVQVQAYGLLLQQRGYDTLDLVHAVATLDRGTPVEGLAELMARTAFTVEAKKAAAPAKDQAIPDPLDGLHAQRVDAGPFTLHVFPHENEAAERTMSWALAYWRGEREPVGTDHAGKCRACAHNAAGVCPTPRALPDGRYAVRTTPGPRGMVHLVVSVR